MPSLTSRVSLANFRARRAGSQAARALESLESRVLMTASYGLVFDSYALGTHSVANIVTKGSAKVTLTNLGNEAPGAGDKGEIHIVARPVGAVDATSDIELGKMLNQAIGFAVNAKKSYTVALTVPANTPLGNYDVLAIAGRTVPAVSTIATALAAHGFSEDAQKLDLHTTLGVVTLPAGGAISGGPVTAAVQVVLTNDGNIATPVGENVSIAFFARPVGGGADVALQTVAPITNKALAGVKPGATKSFSAKVLFPVTVGTGDYEIVATATVGGPTAEEVPENNSAVTSGSVHVTQGFLDFGTTLVSAKGPVAIVQGQAASGSVQAKVTNLGNIKTSAFDSVSVTLVARPQGGGADILLKSLPNQKVASLKEGTGFKNFTLPYTFAKETPSGVYDLIVTTTPDGPGVDIVPTNDVLTLDQSVTVAPAFVDLTVAEPATLITGTVVGGTSGVANVIIKNVGNVPSTGYLVEVFATADGTIPGGATPIGTATSATAKIAAGATLKVPVTYTVPGVVSNTVQVLAVRVTLAADTNAANNLGVAGTITATPIPPVLGNEPSQVTFIEKTYEPVSAPSVGLVQITSTGDVTYAGQALINGDGYFYHVITIGALPKRATLQLGVTPFGLVDILLDFTGTRLNSLSGKTITFTSSSAGATGKFSIPGDFPLAGLTADMKGFFKVT